MNISQPSVRCFPVWSAQAPPFAAWRPAAAAALPAEPGRAIINPDTSQLPFFLYFLSTLFGKRLSGRAAFFLSFSHRKTGGVPRVAPPFVFFPPFLLYDFVLGSSLFGRKKPDPPRPPGGGVSGVCVVQRCWRGIREELVWEDGLTFDSSLNLGISYPVNKAKSCL